MYKRKKKIFRIIFSYKRVQTENVSHYENYLLVK